MRTVFLSSTFRDMYPERDILLEQTIPLINRVAKRYGDSVSFCDLRWGIDTEEMEEEEANRKILDACFDEIDRSAPPMVVILGDRYGWIPPEDLVRKIQASRGVPEGDVEASATAMEIEYGTKIRGYRTLFYFRESEGEEPAPYAAEHDNRSVRLMALKESIKATYGADVKSYRVRFVDGHPSQEDLERFAHQVYEDLFAILYPQWEAAGLDTSWRRELETHRRFVDVKASYFCANRGILESALKAIDDDAKLLILKGQPGVGKSTLLSRLAVELEERGWGVVTAVCGLTEHSGNAIGLLELLIRSLEDSLGIVDTNVSGVHETPEEHEKARTANSIESAREGMSFGQKLISRYSSLCSELSRTGGRHVIMVDSVDQMDVDELASRFAYIPLDELGSKLRFVMTCGMEPDTRTIDGKSTTLFVDTLDEIGKREVIEGVLELHRKNLPRKELSASVADALVAHKGSENPLALTVMIQRLLIMDEDDFELSNRYGDGIESIVRRQREIIRDMPKSLDEMSAKLMIEVAERFNPEMLEKAFAFLAHTRFGLRVSDLGRLLGGQWRYVDFARMRSYLEDVFFERNDGRIDFIHQSFRSGLLLHCRNQSKELHEEILSMLEKLDPADPLRQEETLYQCVWADDRRSFLQHVQECALSVDEAYVKNTIDCIHTIFGPNWQWINDFIDSLQAQDVDDVFLRFLIEEIAGCFTYEEADQRRRYVFLQRIEECFQRILPSLKTSDVERLLEYEVCLELCNAWNNLYLLGKTVKVSESLSDSYPMRAFELGHQLWNCNLLSDNQRMWLYYQVLMFLKCLDTDESKRLASEVEKEIETEAIFEKANGVLLCYLYSIIAELHMDEDKDDTWIYYYKKANAAAEVALVDDTSVYTKLAVANGLRYSGTADLYSGDLEGAARCFEKSLAIFESTSETTLTLRSEGANLRSWIDCCRRLVLVYVLLAIQEDRNKIAFVRFKEARDVAMRLVVLWRAYVDLFAIREDSLDCYDLLRKVIVSAKDYKASFARRLSSPLIPKLMEILKNDINRLNLYDDGKHYSMVIADISGMMQIFRVMPAQYNPKIDEFKTFVYNEFIALCDEYADEAERKANYWDEYSHLYNKSNILTILQKDEFKEEARQAAKHSNRLIRKLSRKCGKKHNAVYVLLSCYQLGRCTVIWGDVDKAYRIYKRGYSYYTRHRGAKARAEIDFSKVTNSIYLNSIGMTSIHTIKPFHVFANDVLAYVRENIRKAGRTDRELLDECTYVLNRLLRKAKRRRFESDWQLAVDLNASLVTFAMDELKTNQRLAPLLFKDGIANLRMMKDDPSLAIGDTSLAHAICRAGVDKDRIFQKHSYESLERLYECEAFISRTAQKGNERAIRQITDSVYFETTTDKLASNMDAVEELAKAILTTSRLYGLSLIKTSKSWIAIAACKRAMKLYERLQSNGYIRVLRKDYRGVCNVLRKAQVELGNSSKGEGGETSSKGRKTRPGPTSMRPVRRKRP